MEFYPEGMNAELDRQFTTPEALRRAMMQGSILESRVLLCDREHNLHVDLGAMRGIIPREEGAVGIDDGTVRDIALISKVGKRVCFSILGFQREDDGPFGEYPGTYSEVRKAPVVEITAITMRKDAIFQNAYTGMPMTENHWMMDLAATALAYREAYKICPDIHDICLTSGGTSRHHCVVSIKKRHPYEPRNVMTALLAANIGIKLCVVVDEDIDVHDMQQVEWAINTRMQADRDVMILPVMYSPTLDPSAPYPRASSKMGIDATAPLEDKEAFAPVFTPGQDAPYIEEMLRDFMDKRRK